MTPSRFFALLPSLPTYLLLIVVLLVAAEILLVIVVVVVLAAGMNASETHERKQPAVAPGLVLRGNNLY